LDHVALLDRTGRGRLLDRADDDVADARVAAAGAAHDADAQDLAGAGVVGDAQPGLVLDHRARSRISISRQRFWRESGRHSITRTLSPARASLRSSCAWSFAERRTVLP